MTEAELNKITFTFIILIALSVHHIYFGRNIPKWSWRLSIVFAIIAGLYIGFTIAHFPGSLILAGTAFIIIFLVNLFVRSIRNRQDDFFVNEEKQE